MRDAIAALAVRAQVAVEGANGLTTQLADEILDGYGSFVAPTFLPNGRVVVSLFEWAWAHQAQWWSLGDVGTRLERLGVRDEACAPHSNLEMGGHGRHRLSATAIRDPRHDVRWLGNRPRADLLRVASSLSAVCAMVSQHAIRS